MITNTVLHYNILEVIGEGGMGIVYKARDLHLDRLVALKFIPPSLTADPSLTNRFIREARSAAQLDHPNICTIHEFEQTEDGQHVIVMAYCQGLTLKKMLLENDQLSIESFLNISLQLCNGIDQAHQEGIIHRDLKPSNIIINSDQQIKILDFGLAGLKEDSSRINGPDSAGTTAYMSPEQAIGNEIDQRSDIWSLGVIMYEMLAGQPPFDSGHEQSQIYSILKDQPELLKTYRQEIPRQLDSIIGKCLEKEPDDRYQKTAELIDELELVQNKEITTIPSPGKSHSRYFWPVAATMIALLLFIAAYHFFPQSDSTDSKIRIVVKPFENVGLEEKYKWLGNGIGHEIRTKLSIISNLVILDKTVWNDTTLNKASLYDIGDKLDVDYIIDGSIQRLNQHLSINVHLINPSTNVHVWGESYDSDTLLIWSTLGDIAGKIAVSLRTKLTIQEERELQRPPTENKLAYNLFIKGKQLFRLGQKENNEHAIRLYKKAIELDPQFSLAYVGLARAYRRRVMRYHPDLVWYNTAFAMIDSALCIDPNCSEAYTALGILYKQDIYMGPDSLSKSIESFKKAIDLNPSNFESYFEQGRLFIDVGYLEDGRHSLYQAIDLNPLSGEAYSYLAWSYYLSGEIEKAREFYHKAYDISPTLGNKFSLYWQEEEYEDGISMYKEILKIDPESEWWRHDLAVMYKNAGHYPESIETFRYLIKKYPGRSWHYFGLANALTEVERFKEATEVYKTALDSCSECRESLMFHYVTSLTYQQTGDTNSAREIINSAFKSQNVKLTAFDNSMEKIIQFYMGNISADSIEMVITEASKKLQRQSYFNSHYFYLAMAYIYNLKPEYVLTNEFRRRAIAHLKRYKSRALKHDVEFSLARIKLKKIGSTN